MALRSRYTDAAEEFLQALQDDPGVDLSKLPGFWRMQPMGYIAAAKAYRSNGQMADARRLLTVVQMAHHSTPELYTLFGRAIEALDEQ